MDEAFDLLPSRTRDRPLPPITTSTVQRHEADLDLGTAASSSSFQRKAFQEELRYTRPHQQQHPHRESTADAAYTVRRLSTCHVAKQHVHARPFLPNNGCHDNLVSRD